MNIIYKSFLKKKSTKIYLLIFMILELVFCFLLVTEKIIIIKGNEAYQNSFLYFSSKDDINFKKEKNIKKYNKAIKVECNNYLTNVFVTENQPIIESESFDSKKCTINNYELEYDVGTSINLIKNNYIYDSLKNTQEEYYYFLHIKNWFKSEEIIKTLSDKYKAEINVKEYKIDDVNYKNIIFILGIFIHIVEILFAILFLISILNIAIDEKKNNFIYYSLGYSIKKILNITINKILIVFLLPLCIVIFIFAIFFGIYKVHKV